MYTEYTPVACITNTTVISQAQITYVLGVQVTRIAAPSLCAWIESVIWSAMSSLCWSLPHFLSSSPPQHEAPPGQHDLLQDDTVHRAPLPEPMRSTSSATEPLSHVKYESGGNPRNTSPTGFEIKEVATKELATISGSSLENIYQLYDVQRDFGEHDQQVSIIEEVKEFGQIRTQSLFDHEMAEMSFVEKMSYLQSQMHFEEPMESIADSDLEDGELQKLLTSPLYAQRASGKPDAMVVQERER